MRISSGRMNEAGILLSITGVPLTSHDLALAAAIKGRVLAASRRPKVELAFPIPGGSSATTLPALPMPLETGWRIPRLLQSLMTAMSSGASTAEGAASGERLTLAERRARRKATDAGGSDDSERSADPEELHQLVVEHGDAVFRLALSVVRDKSLAEDIAQEALIKAWLALPTFRGDSSLRGWLLRITHNTAISTIRRRRAVVIDPHDMPEAPIKVERSVESRVQNDVVMNDFVEALDLLDELSRSIVVLRELEGLSYDEIGEVLNVPLPTVKTRLLRARRKLGAALREWE